MWTLWVDRSTICKHHLWLHYRRWELSNTSLYLLSTLLASISFASRSIPVILWKLVMFTFCSVGILAFHSLMKIDSKILKPWNSTYEYVSIWSQCLLQIEAVEPLIKALKRRMFQVLRANGFLFFPKAKWFLKICHILVCTMAFSSNILFFLIFLIAFLLLLYNRDVMLSFYL